MAGHTTVQSRTRSINQQIQVFQMSQSKSESASTGVVRLRTSYHQAEINKADWDRIECLLILKSITDDSILKELHKDINRVMTSLDILEEAIINLERSMKTLDFQLHKTGDRAARSEASG